MKIRTRLVVFGLSICALLGSGALWLSAATNSSPDYAQVESIERAATYRDATLLALAEQLPVASAYLSHPFEYQDNPSFCGPTTAANLLRSTGRDATQKSVIVGTNVHTIFGLLPTGLTLDEEAALLRQATGAQVSLLRDLDLATFRANLASANDVATRFIVNFHRGPIFGRGHGHFSPILGYLSDRDLVLVGDVNRDYGTYLVSSARLFEAIDTIDSATGKKRGLLRVDFQP